MAMAMRVGCFLTALSVGGQAIPLVELEHLWCHGSTSCVGQAKRLTRRSRIQAAFDHVNPSKLQVHPVLADWDGDGDLDLALISQDSIRFFQHDSKTDVSELSESPFLNRMGSCDVDLHSGFSMVDWNGDGFLDLIARTKTTKPSFDGAAICTQSPHGQFYMTDVFQHPFMKTGKFESIAMVDWDQDGDFDLLVKNNTELIWFEALNGSQAGEAGEAARKHVLPVGPIWHFSALDFDQDGDMDLLLTMVDGAVRYFERDDDDLKEIFEDQNPFHKMSPTRPGELTSLALGDWNGNSEVDVLLLAKDQIWHYQQETRDFVELHRNHSPLRSISNTTEAAAFVDVDADGIVEVVLLDNRSIKCFKHNGTDLVELSHNPFEHAHVGQVPEKMLLIADVDNDGDLDIVRSRDNGGISYYQQEHGHFHLLSGHQNPFNALPGEIGESCPSLVDWDGDHQLDLVLGSTTGHFHYFRQVNKSFQPVTGMDNPFRNVQVNMPSQPRNPAHMDPYPRATAACASFADLDGDGDLDMLVSSGFVYKQTNGSLVPETNLFSEVKEPFSMPILVDWGGGSHDLVLQGTRSRSPMSYYTRGTCINPSCKHGVCDRKSGQCQCPEGFEEGHELGQPTCNPCPAGRAASFAQGGCEVCPSGKFAKPGSAICDVCPLGFVSKNRTDCSRCDLATVAVNGSECMTCDLHPSGELCPPCRAGFAPNPYLRNICIACQPGKYATSESTTCSFCPMGSVPDFQRGQCLSCKPYLYALPGDSECRQCKFPFMLMGKDKVCSMLELVLFLLTFIVTVVISFTLCWLRLRCLISHLDNLKEMHDYEELHLMKASYLEYGLWRSRADSLIAEQKQQLGAESRRLGVSLVFALDELQGLYWEKANATEWRCHESYEITHPGFVVKIRGSDEEDGAGAWETLDLCTPPNDPNFYQLAGLLSYGPSALGKRKICPRDGLPDCSMVDALRKDARSGLANWYLSWTWSYSLRDVLASLRRWWESSWVVTGAPKESIYLWWCFFVNNQFRMLQDGKTEDTDLLLEVFAKPLESAGKVLMCMDKFENCAYVKRIWCIFEVFSAVRRNIPITLIMPGLDIHQIQQPIGTLKELRKACHVNAEEAGASVKADEEKIKAHIVETMTSFEYVNQTVEQALWIEVIKMMKAQKGTHDNLVAKQNESSVNETVTMAVNDGSVTNVANVRNDAGQFFFASPRTQSRRLRL